MTQLAASGFSSDEAHPHLMEHHHHHNHHHHGEEGANHDHMGCVHEDMMAMFDHDELRELSRVPADHPLGAATLRQKRREMQTVTYGSIRFHIDSRLEPGQDPLYSCHAVGDKYIDTNAQGSDVGVEYDCTEEDVITDEKRNFILNELIPETLDWLSESLAVPPVTGNLRLSSQGTIPNEYCYPSDGSAWSGTTCCADQTKQEHIDTGVPNADYIMTVTMRPWRGSVAAWAFPCQLAGNYRPISGQVNFVPSVVSLDAANRRSQFIKGLHEIFHNMGFSDYFFALYRAPGDDTQAAANTVVQNTDANLGKQVSRFTMANAVQKMKEHFNCFTWGAEGAGVELEDQGSAATAGKHLEERLFYTEMMSGWIHANSVPTPVSLAFLEDSGWYQVDYSRTERMVWGNGEGCDFVQQRCAAWDERYFCTQPAAHGCTPDLLSKAQCNLNEMTGTLPAAFQYFSGSPKLGGQFYGADYCPIYAAFSNGNCADTGTASYYYYGEFTGSGARCFMGNWILAGSTGYDGSQHGTCLQTTCNALTNLIEITLSPGEAAELVVTCPVGGGDVDLGSLSSTWTGTLKCPAASVLCSGNPCDIQDCNGHGSCVEADGTCMCDAGWYGDDTYHCDKKSCPVGSNGEVCSGNADCNTRTGECSDAQGLPGCFPGWSLADCSRAGCPDAVSGACPTEAACECAGLGTCGNGTCACNPGFIGFDCSYTDCPGTPRCGGSDRGSCDQLHGICECNEVANQTTGTTMHYAGQACEIRLDGPMVPELVQFTNEYLDGADNLTEPVLGTVEAKVYRYFAFDVPSTDYDISITLAVTDDYSDPAFRLPTIVASYESFGLPTINSYEFISSVESSRTASLVFGAGSGNQPSRFNEVGTIIFAIVGLDKFDFRLSLERNGCAVLECSETGSRSCENSRCNCQRTLDPSDPSSEYGWAGQLCDQMDCPGTPDCSGVAGQCVLSESGFPVCECDDIHEGAACQLFSITSEGSPLEGAGLFGAALNPTSQYASGDPGGPQLYTQTGPSGQRMRIVNATYRGTVGAGAARTPFILDPAELLANTGLNGTQTVYVRMRPVQSADADPMLLMRKGSLPSLTSYDYFDRAAWAALGSQVGSATEVLSNGAEVLFGAPHELVVSLDKLQPMFFQVRNGRYATAELTYEVYAEVTENGCPPSLNDCSGHGVGQCTGKCICQPGWEGIRCDVRAPTLESGVMVTVDPLAPGEWGYYLLPTSAGVAGTVVEVEVELARAAGASTAAQPLVVAAWEQTRRSSTLDLITGESAMFDYDGFVEGAGAVAGNSTILASGMEVAPGYQHLTIFRSNAQRQQYLVVAVHNLAGARANLAGANLTVTRRATSAPLATCDPASERYDPDSCCSGRGTLASVSGRQFCDCQYGWSDDTRCASPSFASFQQLTSAAQTIEFLCALCSKDFTMAKGSMRFFKVPQPLQKGVALRLDVGPGTAEATNGTAVVTASGSAGAVVEGVPSLLVSQTLPRSILDFVYIHSSSNVNESVTISGASDTGKYFAAVYANTAGTYRLEASREELGITSTQEQYFAAEVANWLFNTGPGKVVFASCLVLALLIVGVCVMDNCMPSCIARHCMARDVQQVQRENDMMASVKSARRLSRMATMGNVIARAASDGVDDSDTDSDDDGHRPARAQAYGGHQVPLQLPGGHAEQHQAAWSGQQHQMAQQQTFHSPGLPQY